MNILLKEVVDAFQCENCCDLKELTIRYSPKGDNLFQLVKDYYAVFGLWQQIGAGGQPGAASERKTEMVNDVMVQVAKMVQDRINKRAVQMQTPEMHKELRKFNHAAATENWLDFTAALSDIVRKSATLDRSGDLAKVWKSASATDVSPSLWNLFGGRPPTPEPAWKKYDKPLRPPKDATGGQRELPIAGSQIHLPFPKMPQMPDDLPKMATPMAGTEPKRLGGNWEKLLTKFNYDWDESSKEYKNSQLGTTIRINPDNSANVTTVRGIRKDFVNLGLLLRALDHNRKKRHGKEPIAQVTEGDFVQLYEFLYT